MHTILIVEDEILEQQFLKEIVEEEMRGQCHIITCTTGTQAIEAARETKPDIILMDVWLPELDGMKALTVIRQFCPQAAVIILSACSDFSYAQQAIRLQVRE